MGLLESESPTLTTKRILPSSPSMDQCCQGSCNCDRLQVQTTFEVGELSLPRLLGKAGPTKTSILPQLQGKASVLPLHKHPVQTAQDLLQHQPPPWLGLGPRAESSRRPASALTEDEKPEERLRKRLQKEKWAAERDEMMERVALAREQLHDPVQQTQDVMQRRELLKGALEVSLQGLLSLVEEGPKPKKAVAEAAKPEILRLDENDSLPFAFYEHSVKVFHLA